MALNSQISYQLSAPQFRVFRDPSRFRVLCAGRRFGKTHLACIELLTGAVNGQGTVNWYVAPTYRQAEQIAWAKLKEIVPAPYISRKNESDLSMILRNGSTIALRGADNPDSLRGPGLDLVIPDEAAFMKSEAWTEVLRPALSDRLGRALFISTPCGYNWFYDLYAQAKGREGWASYQFTTLQGGNVPPEEIEAARQDLDEKTFRQEYEASFESLTGRVYYAYDRDENAKALQDIPSAPLLIGMDFNVNPMTAVVCVRAADQIHAIGEIVMRDGNTEEMGRALKARYPGRTMTVYPDPTGNSRKTSAPVGKTDFSILREMGFKVLAPSHVYAVADKINTVNAAMRSAAGTRRAFIDPAKCPQLAKALDGLVYREGTSEPDKSLGLDHITDAFAYLIMWELPICGPRVEGLL